MQIADLSTSRGILVQAARELREKWLDTSAAWRDENSRQFAEQVLEPLGPQLSLLWTAIQALEETLHQAEQDLSDEESITRE